MGASAGCVNKVMTGVIDITRNCGSVRINIDNTCYRVVNILFKFRKYVISEIWA